MTDSRRRTTGNVVANFVGRVSASLISLAAVPIYLERMGREAFALVGIFTSLQIIQTILDVGLGLELSRRTARLMQQPEEHSGEIADLVRTFGLVYGLLGLLVALGCAAASPFVGGIVVHPVDITERDIGEAFLILGVYLGVQWPSGMATSILASAERQGLQNAIATTSNVVRALATLAVLTWVEATPRAFAAAQMVVALGQWLALTLAVRHVLPHASRPPVVRWDIVRASWSANIAAAGLTILQVVIAQTDRVVLATRTQLATLALYNLAAALAANLTMFVSPIYSAYFPRFCRTVVGDGAETVQTLLEGSRLMALVSLPPALTLATFSFETLWAWTGDESIAREAAPLLSALALGYAVAAIHHLPQAIQYASGWLRPQIAVTALAATFAIVWYAFGGTSLPIETIAFGWLIINAALLLFAAPVAVRKFAPSALAPWLLETAGVAAGVGVATAAARAVLAAHDRAGSLAVVIAGASASLVGAAAGICLTPAGRTSARTMIKRLAARRS